MACGQLRIESPQEQDARQAEIDAALAAFGLVATEPVAAGKTFALWPENLPAFQFWQSIQTQWHSGMNGATGLNYAGVQATMELRPIRKSRRAALFAAVQAMEQATLNEWAKKK